MSSVELLANEIDPLENVSNWFEATTQPVAPVPVDSAGSTKAHSPVPLKSVSSATGSLKPFDGSVMD